MEGQCTAEIGIIVHWPGGNTANGRIYLSNNEEKLAGVKFSHHVQAL